MQVLADATQVQDMLQRIARQVDAHRRPDRPWAVIGIRSRGDILAERLAGLLGITDRGRLDITLYRDDLAELGPQPVVRTTEIDFPIDGMNLLLVDDVLMTGRSVRAALQSLVDLGRPRCVKLAVLVDRGGRELPICPDFVGMTITAAGDQQVEVRLQPTDPDDQVVLFDRPPDNEEQP